MNSNKTKSSGYVPCACRDCFEIAIGISGEAMCHDCNASSCELNKECKAPDAYAAYFSNEDSTLDV